MTQSMMAKEASESPKVIAEQLRNNQQLCQDIAQRIRDFAPEFVYIIGRGSSDHAGVYAKYLIEVELGLAVSSSAPSVFSIYNRKLSLDRALVIVISQSGGSPDIIAQTKAARESGAMTIGLINAPASPLSHEVDAVLPLYAGNEQAIAATKSYLCTLSAIAHLVAHWKGDNDLLDSLEELPLAMQAACDSPARLNKAAIANVKHCVVLGRGFGYAISREIALKLKEVLSIHAEAFSSAEFLHGPVTLTNSQLFTISVDIDDESSHTHQAILQDIEDRGSISLDLSMPSFKVHKRLIALMVMLRFYLDLELVARQMNKDPDNPPGLLKVTKTL